ncbi:MAG: hypothetical protein ACK6CU_28915 [Deltaproteobacteria bacterium]
MSARSLAAFALLALAVFGLTHALSLLPHAPRGPRVAPTRDAGPASDVGGFWTEDPERFGPEGEVREPPERDVFACLVPRLAIAREEACERGASYPECRWQLPDETASGGLYAIWRNTTPEHRWARPALVSLVLAAAREYAMRWPGERVTVGDLDAAGPRHQTHRDGVDVDLYLEHAMADRNEPGRPRIDNYHGLSRRAVRLHRARVLDLAKILAHCGGGRVRIYYADRDVVDAFRVWFAASGLVSDVSSQAMQMHNDLHRFHFHLTVARDLSVLPSE